MIIKPANRTNSVSEYYFSKKLQEIDLMNRQGAEVINLGIGAGRGHHRAAARVRRGDVGETRRMCRRARHLRGVRPGRRALEIGADLPHGPFDGLRARRDDAGADGRIETGL